MFAYFSWHILSALITTYSPFYAGPENAGGQKLTPFRAGVKRRADKVQTLYNQYLTSFSGSLPNNDFTTFPNF